MRTCLFVLSVAALSFAASAQAQTPLNDADCEATWKAAGGTDLTPDKAKPFIASFDQVDIDHNGAINWEEFKAGCAKGLVTK
ncbi:MAG TPA: EF-hand domain-containing protein [Hyphomicrobium sp.]|nr:EF-hand domain-containing protein [Hyphomicrobium sp.]